MLSRLRARQVHLDFHTSELIPGVGLRFSKKQFQQALKLGRVNSITIFAKCHHAWSYYPTKVGRKHPTLKIDLMGKQIQACHEIGVRCPIYYTVGWSANDAADHPEWHVRNQDGTSATISFDVNAKPEDKKPGCSWIYLCPSGSYREHIVAQTKEIVANHAVDGFFYDICEGPACYCAQCRAGMQAAGLDPACEADAQRYHVIKWQAFMAECNAAIHAKFPEATIFYNGTTKLGGAHEEILACHTHYELEDLPTTWGGYDRFPLRAKYYQGKAGKPMLAMSGKFHTSWGEFGGFKHPDALKFEAAGMIAYGAACSIGDQLHPAGEMDLETYRWLGEAYRYVEQIEDYGLDSQPCANLGLWLCNQNPHDQGVANMLLESQIDFEVIRLPENPTAADLARYQTIILPGAPCLDDFSAALLRDYVAAGGSLLALAGGPLDAAKTKFLLDVGAKYVGPARFDSDYLLAAKPLQAGIVTTPFLCYTAAPRVKAARGAAILANIREPYFDRRYGHYCSHQNTPYQLKDAPQPGAVQQGRVIYLAHPLGEMYYHHGARIHRDFFLNALRRLYTQPTLSTQLPSAGRANLLHQPQHRRYVAHLLYGPPLQRGRCLIIEDLPGIRDVPVTLRVPEKVKRAVLPLAKKTLPLRRKNGALTVTVPRVQCHDMVVFEY